MAQSKAGATITDGRFALIPDIFSEVCSLFKLDLTVQGYNHNAFALAWQRNIIINSGECPARQRHLNIIILLLLLTLP